MKDIHILLIEDNEGDIVLTKESLTEARIRNKLSIATDGEKALNFLFKENEYTGEETPDLILLDINLPKIDGIEVLKAIKSDEHLKIIPVVMLTTSEAEKDILDAYKNHVNCYITKPINLEKFIDVIKSIENFWLHIVKLPTIN
ncbi:MAG: response regulator [Bacteroidetes bacterium]|nr:response regulator [Bacteroidota bacterium]